jgi:hypothetical protein
MREIIVISGRPLGQKKTEQKNDPTIHGPFVNEARSHSLARAAHHVVLPARAGLNENKFGIIPDCEG